MLIRQTGLKHAFSLLADDSDKTISEEYNVIIAAGPIICQGTGSVPTRVVVRYMASGRIAVHDQHLISDGKIIHFSNGLYLENPDTNVAISLAMDEFTRRVKKLVQ